MNGVEIDRGAVLAGAVAAAVVALPIQLGVLASDPDTGSNWWLLALVVLVFACALGGYRAARDQPEAMLAHGSLAGAVAYVLVAVVAVPVASLLGDGSTPIGEVVSRVFVGLLVSSTAGMLGGLLRGRGVRPPGRPTGSRRRQ